MPAPTKLFDVSNGNGAVIGGETVDRGTLIWFRGNAAKSKVIDAFVYAYGYQDNVDDPNNPGQTIPNPVSKQPYFNRIIRDYIRDVVRGREIAVAEATARATAAGAIDTDLPVSAGGGGQN